jgi:hypothetical protein
MMNMEYDLLIRGGRVVDDWGSPGTGLEICGSLIT